MRLGVITRAGDEALRPYLVVGATSVIKQVSNGKGNASPWLRDLVARKPPKLAAVALANKVARIAWKLMVSANDTMRHGPASSPDRKDSTVLASSRPLRAACGGGLRQP